MLAGLAELREEAGFVLHCIHVEHGIRPAGESRGDARAVEELCGKLRVPCRVVSIPPGKIAAFAGRGGPGIEAAARIFRQRAFKQEARRLKADWILTAHTRDDALETLLIRILRGSGPAGLAAMPRTRGALLRPLLDMTRKDVLAYLDERGISYRTDATNTDLRFLRNRVRYKLVPVLDDFFPSWRSSLLSLAETQSLSAAFLASEVRKILPWEECEGVLRVKEADFLNAAAILQEEAVFEGADILAGRARDRKSAWYVPVPRRAALRRALGQGIVSQSDLGPVRLDRRNGYVTLSHAIKPGGEKGFSLLVREPGTFILKGSVLNIMRNLELCVHPDGEGVDSLPLVFRNYREGDRILRGGHRRGFSDILDSAGCSGYTGIITVCDLKGIAAIVGMTGDGCILVANRESAGLNEAGDGFSINAAARK